MKKIRPIIFNTPALHIATTLAVEGSVPGHQTYNTDFDAFVPDYTIAHLTLQPRVSVNGQYRNENLASVAWYQDGTAMGLYGAEEQREGWIVTPAYEICLSGGDAGRLILKSNPAAPLAPVTLKFTATYVDTLSGDAVAVEQTYLLICDTETAGKPRLELDAAAATMYNPLRSQPLQTVSARLFIGEREALAAKCTYAWEVKEGSNWVAVGADILHHYLTLSAGGSAVTVDRRHMGMRCDLRCTATYNPGGGVPTSTYTALASIVRRIPEIDYNILGVPASIRRGTLAVSPEVVVKDSMGDIDTDRYAELEVLWYIATNNASGNLSYGSPVTQGQYASMPTTKLDAEHGAVLAVDVTDRGGTLSATDYDGSVFTDYDGAILLI